MPEFVLVWRLREDTLCYVVAANSQGALSTLIQLFEHFAGSYSYVMYDVGLHPLRWQVDRMDRISDFTPHARWFYQACEAMLQTGPGLEKP